MKNKLILSLLIASFMISVISAFGVSSPYWDENPMKAYPGQSTQITLDAQNLAGATEDVDILVEILEGGDLISISKTEYNIPAGERKDILLNVKIPEEAEIGASYPIRVNVRTITPSEDGGVSMNIGTLTKFNIEIIEKPEEISEINYLLYLSIAILVILIIVIFIVIKRKKKKK